MSVKKLAYYAGLYTASNAFLKLLGFVLFLWLARTLSVDDYANFGLLYALQTGLVTFGLVGIVEAVVGLLKEHRSKAQQKQLFAAANSAFFITLIISIILALILFLTFFGNAKFSLTTVISVVATGALLAYSVLQTQIMRLEEKQLPSLYFDVALPLAGFIGGSIAFFLQRTVQSFFLGSIIALIIISVGLWINRIGFYGLTNRIAETYPILLRIAPFIAVAFLGWLSGYGNNYVVNFFYNSTQVAKYTFALTLSSAMQLIATALNQVWAPRFYQITHDLPFEEVERKNTKFYRMQGLALGLFGGLVIAIFPAAMNLLKGNLVFYQSMSLELMLLFSSYVILSPFWHCNNYFLAYDKGPKIMRITVTTSAIGIFIWIILMWQLGPIGIYVGFMSQMLIRSAGITLAAKKHWPVKISWDGVAGGILLVFLGFMLTKY